jgi:GH25 family lysozyme M1 (1,4-beta-N-acetylmuramidase)
MTVRRIAALAQALAMTTLLLPGPDVLGPASTWAAVEPPPPSSQSTTVFDAAGRGIGCEPRSARFRGPQPPRDPPWPPGAEPSPSPEPPASPAPDASPDASASPDADASSAATASPVAGGGTAFLQAEASLSPDEVASGGSDADIAPDVPSRRARDRAGYVRGIDVSHHNDDIDFAKVRRAGYDFVFIKATQDNDFIDPMFLTNMARAKAAGLAAGGYHFFDYTLDGRVQADHFVDRLELADGIDDALPPVVDVECWAPIGSSIHAVSATRLRDFVARVYERTGRLPIIYTSVFMWREVVGNAEGFTDHPLWAACWGCEAPPAIAPGWDGWAFWQTGIDRVRGVKRLDGNVFSGTVEDLTALRLRPVRLAAGAPATATPQVEVDLGGREATHLRTSRDGEAWSGWQPIRSTPQATVGTEEGSHTLHVQLRHGPGRLSPVYVDSIALDLTGPQVSMPEARLRLGPLGGTDGGSVPIDVTWDAVDEIAGLGDATLAVACGGARPERSAAPGTADPGVLTRSTASAFLVPGGDCDITVVGRDGAGNSSRATAASVSARVVGAADGQAPDSTVEGGQVGVIARRGPDGGRASISVDDEPIGLIDLYAPEPTGPEVVFVAEIEPGVARTVSLEPTGERDPASTGDRVTVDGFVTLTTG